MYWGYFNWLQEISFFLQAIQILVFVSSSLEHLLNSWKNVRGKFPCLTEENCYNLFYVCGLWIASTYNAKDYFCHYKICSGLQARTIYVGCCNWLIQHSWLCSWDTASSSARHHCLGRQLGTGWVAEMQQQLMAITPVILLPWE